MDIFYKLTFLLLIVNNNVFGYPSMTPVNSEVKEISEKTKELPELLNMHKRVVVCYVSDESSQFSRDYFDCKLCTHVIINAYTFSANATTNTMQYYLQPHLKLTDWSKMKQKCPHIKLSVSFKELKNSESYYNVIMNEELRKKFVIHVKSILRDFQFDGIDFDFDIKVFDETFNKTRFYPLLDELRSALGNKTLTALLSKEIEIIEKLYDLSYFSFIFDFIHIKSFDYRTKVFKTEPTSPLYGNHRANMAETLQLFKSKHRTIVQNMVFGIMLSGQQYTFSNSMIHHRFEIDTINKRSSEISYNQICKEFNEENNTWIVTKDSETRTPYAQYENKFISYEDEWSVNEKAKFAVRSGLAGVMIWTIDKDDWEGECNKKAYPLLLSINNGLIDAVNNINTYMFDDMYHDTETISWYALVSLIILVILSIILAIIFACLKINSPLFCPSS